MNEYDVVVVGGGTAALNGALMLVRSRRSVLVVDGGEPRNASADALHGFLSRDGMAPAALLAAGRDEVLGYGGEIVGAQAVAVGRTGAGFAVQLDTGATVQARRLLVATGLRDVLPDVPGLAQRWGKDVLQCPYCHGWEVRDQAIGVLSTGPFTAHQALMFRQLSDRVTVFEHTGPTLGAGDRERLAARAIEVVPGEVEGLEVTDDRLTGIRLAGGELVGLDALTIGADVAARAELLEPIGIEPVAHPVGIGTYVPTEPGGRTSVPGLWIAGSLSDPTATLLVSAAAGATAGAMINGDLVDEEAGLDVAQERQPA